MLPNLATRLLNPVEPWLYHRAPVPDDASMTIRYLGTAGFVLEAEGHTLVIDPYVTRPGLLATVTRPLTPDRDLIGRVIPKADDVLIGHAHFDHVLDAPDLCHMTGARFIGSPSACNVARAGGLKEAQIVSTRGREDIESGPALLRGVPSLPGRIYGNRVPLPGPIPEPPAWPPRYRDLKCGLVLNWLVEMAGVRVMHIDSADFYDHELEGMRCDVLCLCAIGRRYRPRYVESAVALLQPKVVIACHWDYFFTPYEDEPLALPGVDLPGFVAEIREAGAQPVVLPFDGMYGATASH